MSPLMLLSHLEKIVPPENLVGLGWNVEHRAAQVTLCDKSRRWREVIGFPRPDKITKRDLAMIVKGALRRLDDIRRDRD